MPLSTVLAMFRTARNLFVGTVRFVFYFSVVVLVVGLGAGIGVVKTFSKQLPEIGYHSYKPSINTKVYDSRGNLMAEFHEVENRREKVPLARIPKIMQDAIISIEDARFFNHYGIDPVRIIGAALTNLRSKRRAQGASTITQQLARNAFLTFERTYTRKIKEILLSFNIEKKFTKYEILELYLNEIYFGHGAWGIASAAHIYFGKRPEELTLPECALLAGLPRSPSDYDPFRNRERAKSRQVIVLNQMVENGYITEAEAREAKNSPVRLHTRKPSESGKSTYFVEHVRQFLIGRFGPKQVYTEGLKVYTTLDPEMQAQAESAFCGAKVFEGRPLETHPTLQGGLVALDPATGHVKAMVGGRDFKRSEFNRVTQAKRQPGSAFKTFVFLAALEAGMKPNTTLVDEPIEIVNRFTGKVWQPKNYGNSYAGAVTLKTAFAKSLNSIAVKIIQKIGPTRVISATNRCGITSKMGAHLAIALGTADLTLMEMATGYATIANLGIRVDPVVVTKVLDASGNVLFQSKYTGEQVVDPTIAYTLIDIMRGVVEHGTGTRAKIGRPSAGKTGTTNGYVDAWYCGFTPNLVCCTYVGHDDRTPLPGRLAGGIAAAPIWKDFMEKAVENLPAVDFRPPEGTVRVTVCRDSGLLPSPSCKQTTSSNFTRGMEPEEICDLHDGTPTADNYYETAALEGDMADRPVRDAVGALLKPTRVKEDTGRRIETDEALEPDPQPADARAAGDPDAPAVETREERRPDRHRPVRSRFRNAHAEDDLTL